MKPVAEGGCGLQPAARLGCGYPGENLRSGSADRLGFLCTDFGFTGPDLTPNEEGVYPLLRRIRFDRAGLAVEVGLVLSYMGEEYVAAHCVTVDESGSKYRTESGRHTVHTGYQMQRALDLLAQATRQVVSVHTPDR